jgi:hypothetical protein
MAVTTVAGWCHSPRTGELAVLAGAALIGACVKQFQVLQTFSWLQPAGLFGGTVLMVLGMKILRSPSGSGGGSR